MNIKIRVSNLTKKWETRDPYQLCKYLKINVIYRELGGIKGYYTKCLRKKFIIINSELDEFSEKIVLAHELGHALLHNDDILFMKSCFVCHKSSLYEKEANLFTTYLLKEDSYSLEEYQEKCCLSYEIMDELNRIKE